MCKLTIIIQTSILGDTTGPKMDIPTEKTISSLSLSLPIALPPSIIIAAADWTMHLGRRRRLDITRDISNTISNKKYAAGLLCVRRYCCHVALWVSALNDQITKTIYTTTTKICWCW